MSPENNNVFSLPRGTTIVNGEACDSLQAMVNWPSWETSCKQSSHLSLWFISWCTDWDTWYVRTPAERTTRSIQAPGWGSYLMWWITFYQLNSCCPVRSCKVQYFPDQRNCIKDIQDTSVEYSHTCFVGPYCLGFNCFLWKCFMLNYNLREYNLTISCIGSSVQHSLRHIQPLLS